MGVGEQTLPSNALGSFRSIKEAASSKVVTQAIAQASEKLRQLEPLLRQLGPYLQAAKVNGLMARETLEPYYDEEAPALAAAAVLLLFGKRFALTLACYQAFKLSGTRLIVKRWDELKERYQEERLVLRQQPETKDLFDFQGEAGGEGVMREFLVCLRDVSVAQTPEEQVMCKRKVVLLLRCVDAEKVRELCYALWNGSIACLATLRSRALYAASLGAAVGRRASQALVPLAGPRLCDLFPQQQQLVNFALQIGPRALGVLVGLALSRAVCAFNAAQQGSGLLLAAFLRMAQRRKWLDVATLTEEKKHMAVWILALIGFGWQIRPGNKLPVVLRLPMAPFYIVEGLLALLATH